MTKKESKKDAVLLTLKSAAGRLTAWNLADYADILETAESCPNTR